MKNLYKIIILTIFLLSFSEINVYGISGFCDSGLGTSENRESSSEAIFMESTLETGSISGPTRLCSTYQAEYTVSGASATTGYTWSVTSGAISSGQGTNTVTITFYGPGIGRIVSVTGNGISEYIIVNVYTTSIPTISGPETVCPGGTATYSIVPSMQSWMDRLEFFPTLGTKVSRSDFSITVSFPEDFTRSQIIAYGIFGSCGAGPATHFDVTATTGTIPGAAGTITGSSLVDPGQTGVPFSVPSISGATEYHWELPSGVSIISGENSNSILVNFSSYFKGGVITVAGSNGTCDGPVSVLEISSSGCSTLLPGEISGRSSVCPGQTGVEYSIPSIDGATRYVWKLPDGGEQITITPSVKVNFSSKSKGGIIAVYAKSNSCNQGPSVSKKITVKNLLKIMEPDPICQGTTGVGFTATTSDGTYGTDYKWYKNDALVTDNGPGVPGYAYVPQKPLVDGDRIWVTAILNSDCVQGEEVTSNIVIIETIEPFTPYVTIGASIQLPATICEGEAITFTANPGNASYSLSNCQWYVNGFPVVNNNSNTFTTSSFTEGNIVKVISEANGACLNDVTVEGSTIGYPIAVLPSPNFTLSPTGDLKICSECTKTLSISPTDPEDSYAWYRNGLVISEEALPSYTASQQGTYSVTVTNNGCIKQSENLVLKKNIRPVANSGPERTVILPDNSINIVGNGSDQDGTIEAYLWKKVSGPTATLNSVSSSVLSLSELTKGEYVFSLSVKDNFGETSLPSEVIITVLEPDNYYSWIKTTVVIQEGELYETNLDDLEIKNGQKYESYAYFDGLGRSMQQVGVQSSPGGRDMVQPVIYDEIGREKKKYLPYVSDEVNGWYKPKPVGDDTEENPYITSPQFQFYQSTDKIANDLQPYSETVFESSPLNRPLKQGAPGTVWQPEDDINADDHSMKFQYTTNGYEEVLLWEVSPDNQCVLSTQQYFEEKQLYVTITKDENWTSIQANINDGTVREYKDKMDRVVLKRTYNENEAHDTYYVYDDYGNLRFVLPPEAIRQIGTGTTEPEGLNILDDDTTFPGGLATDENYYYMPPVTVTLGPGIYTDGFGVEPYQDLQFDSDLLFVYRYDERQRMIVKKVPGADSVYMVYDNRDRLVLTQDGNQREANQWLFTKYDHLNRPVITGIYTSSLSREEMQNTVNLQAGNTVAWHETFTTGTGNFHGYDNASFPNTNISSYLTVSYYDNYDFLALAEFDANYDFGSANGIYTETNTTNVKGLTTGSKVVSLGDNSWLQTVTYYDKKYRPLRIVANNNVGGFDKVYNKYDFVGKVLQTQSVHSKSGDSDLTIDERYEYDHAQRLLYTEQSLDGGTSWVRIIDNDYNELGELITKNLHSVDNGTSYAQSVDYTYNIRGWLTDINDPSDLSEDYFGMKLRYNDPQATGQLDSKAQYNGNISEITWQNIQNVNLSTYGFDYDGLNRLSTAEYGETALYLEDKNFNESLTYDYNGNILSLQRTGEGTLIDNLTYDYMGNQLASVEDASTYNADLAHFKDGHTGASPDYSYDANGNMVVDLNKGIADIQYNHLNLPEFIDFGNGNSITYYYDAAGIKLKKIVNENGTIKVTDYVGGLVYEDGQRQFLQTAEGRIMLNNETMTGPEYQYHLKDHLGNTRVTFTTAPEENRTSSYLATMEPEVAALEEATFSILDYRDATANHTLGGSTSIRTNKAQGRIMGPSMGLHVMPGDKLNISAYFMYDDDQAVYSGTVVDVANLIANNIATGATGELLGITDGIANNPGSIANLALDGNNSRPKAYIHYLYFDKDYNYQSGGMAQVSTTTGAFQELSLQFTADREGYVLVYTANQTAEDLDVFIDDLLVEHIESPVIRTDDYYPFGLAFNSAQRTGVMTNKYLYNGKELQTDLNLDWYDYGARMYDAAIGRWSAIDDMIEDNHHDYTPYAYCYNNPVLLIDPVGLDTILMTSTGVIGKRLKDDKNDFDVLLISNAKEAKTGKLKRDKDGKLKDRHKTLKIEDGMLDFYSTNDKGMKIDLSNTSGDINKLFEFVADNTSVEWTLQSIENKSKTSKIFLSTSHESGSDKWGSHISIALSKTSSIKEHTHNHPTNYRKSKDSEDNVKPSKADITFRDLILKTSPKAKFYIYNKRYGRRNYDNDKTGWNE